MHPPKIDSEGADQDITPNLNYDESFKDSQEPEQDEEDLDIPSADHQSEFPDKNFGFKEPGDDEEPEEPNPEIQQVANEKISPHQINEPSKLEPTTRE